MSQAHPSFEQFAPSLEQFLSRCRQVARLSWKYAFACLLIFSLTPRIHAQSTFGAIVGTVKDASGAVIPNATVRLTNAGTAAERVATSDTHGDYSFLNLNAGKYQITVTASGFEQTDFSDLDLQSLGPAAAPAAMSDGSIAAAPAAADPAAVHDVGLGKDLKERERELILATLRVTGGSRKLAAERLGISPRTLRHKLQQFKAAGVTVPRLHNEEFAAV